MESEFEALSPEAQAQAYRKLQEENKQLKYYLQIYNTAMSLTTNTITVVDIPKRTLNQLFNEGEWTGVTESMANAPESIIATGIVHPDDCDLYRQFYNDIYTGKPQTECTFRVMGAKRGWVWFTMYAKTLYDADGNPMSAAVFSEDVTVKKQAQQNYKNYRDVVTSDADFIWEANLTADVMIHEPDANSSFFAQAGFDSYTDICKVAFGRLSDEYREQVEQVFSRDALLNAYNNAEREISLQYPFRKAEDSETIWLHSVAYLTTNYAGDICVIVCSKDITTEHQKKIEMEHQAQRDPLCGLYNRRFFETYVEECLRSVKNERPVFLQIDVDDFKQINDKWGHVFGDEVLMRVSNALLKNFRSSDLLARAGGDEFMAFLQPSMPPSVLRERMTLLRESLKGLPTPDGGVVDISLTVGGVLYRPGYDFTEMYRRADKAMYYGKQHGKGQYIELGEDV